MIYDVLEIMSLTNIDIDFRQTQVHCIETNNFVLLDLVFSNCGFRPHYSIDDMLKISYDMENKSMMIHLIKNHKASLHYDQIIPASPLNVIFRNHIFSIKVPNLLISQSDLILNTYYNLFNPNFIFMVMSSLRHDMSLCYINWIEAHNAIAIPDKNTIRSIQRNARYVHGNMIVLEAKPKSMIRH